MDDTSAEWTLTLRQVLQDVQLQAIETRSCMRKGVSHHPPLASAVRRLQALFHDEIWDRKRGIVEEAFKLFVDELWCGMTRVLVARKVTDEVVETIASLVSAFLASPSPGKAEVLAEVVQRLQKVTRAEDRLVRLRACQMLQRLVTARANELDEPLQQDVRRDFLRRATDKVTAIRIQSIYGLKTFQTTKESDPVTEELVKLMVMDPSKDVRKAALLTIVVTKTTYKHLLVRIRDTSEDVRYAAFCRIGDVMPLEDIPITDRAHLLDQGLQDRAARVRRACKQMVLTKWFPECESSPMLLLKALDIEQHPSIGSNVSRILLQHFSEQPRAMLGKEDVVEYNALELLSKNSDALNAESIFFWREQCYFYQKIQKDPQKAAALVPNVSDYSKLLVTTCKAQSDVLFIAQQLLELGHLLDFQDEFGRRNLLDSLQKLLRELETDSQLIKGIMELMAFIYSGSSEQEFIQVVAEIISDMYDPVEALNHEIALSQQEDSEIASSQQEPLTPLTEDEVPTLSFGPHLHKLNEEEREAAEIKFDELEKHIETLEVDSDEYRKVQAEMVKVEALLQDPRVLSWLRCLEIVAQLLKLTSHNLSDPVVEGMGRYILPAIDSDVPALREAGLENLGLFCLLDKRIAERYLIVFWRALNNPEEESEIKHTCVQALLDTVFSFSNLQLHIFGAKQVEDDVTIDADEGVRAKEGDGQDATDNSNSVEDKDANKVEDKGADKVVDKDRDQNEDEDEDMDRDGEVTASEKLDLDTIFIGLAQLITVDDLDLQSTIVEGFCRLFMMERIDNITVLAILLETCFSPKLQNIQKRDEHGFQSRSLQLLSIFFPAFVMATATNCMLLEEAATHLIQKSMEKLESDSMLDLSACAKYVMYLLNHNEQAEEAAMQVSGKKRTKKWERRHCAHHNRIGITICLEMLALEKVAALSSVRQDVVTTRQKALVKMITWIEVTLDEQRSALLLQYLLQQITSSCFSSQKGLLRSAEAALKRICTSFREQSTDQSNDQQTVALEQDQTWANDLVREREEVLQKVLVMASAEHEKWLKKQEREKKLQRRRTARYVSSDSADSSESESDENGEDMSAAVPPARRELSSRRSKTAAVNRMHEKEGEFEAKIKQALQDADADDDDDDDDNEFDHEESDSDEDEASDADWPAMEEDGD